MVRGPRRIVEIERKEPRYILPILLGIFALLNLIDWIITDYAMKKGFVELNPIAKLMIERELFDEFKFLGVILSVCASAFVGWGESKNLFEKYKWVYNLLVGIIVTGIISYMAVLVNNVMQLKNRTQLSFS